MPINESLMRALKKQYGPKKGEDIYYAMEAEGKKATQPAAIRKSKRHAKAKRRQ